MRVDDLEAAELVELLAGMPGDCRFYEQVTPLAAATVETMGPQTADAYLEGLRRHGRNVVVSGGAS